MSPLYAPSVYRNIARAVGTLVPASGGAADYSLLPQGAVIEAGANSAFGLLDLDPADFGGMFRIRARCANNNVDSAITATIGLFPIGTYAGGATNNSAVLGTVVTGSQTAALDPAVNAAAGGVSGAFTISSAGDYCLGVTTSGTPAASSSLLVTAVLQARNT